MIKPVIVNKRLEAGVMQGALYITKILGLDLDGECVRVVVELLAR